VVSASAYHLTVGALVHPRASRGFLKAVANAITDFRGTADGALPQRTLQALCPGIESLEFPMTVSLRGEFELPTTEHVYLGCLVEYLKPATLFEIGTNRGRTTRLLAERSGPQARVYTLELPPQRMLDARCFPEARPELIGEKFRHQPIASKIVQLYGDSRTFDFSPYDGAIDFAFIDGDHTYEGVKRDTENVLRMVPPGGVIIWDDYHPESSIGVTQYLHQLSRRLPVCWIRDTRLAYYRVPA